jgi:hypothetical protein
MTSALFKSLCLPYFVRGKEALFQKHPSVGFALVEGCNEMGLAFADGSPQCLTM